MYSGYSPGAELLNQTFEVTTIYNETIPFGFQTLDYLSGRKMTSAIVFGVRIGAAGAVLLAQFLMVSDRRKPVFILNQLCLVLLLIQSSLYVAYLLGPFSSFGGQLTGSYAGVSDDAVNLSCASAVFQFLLIAAIESSLFFQCLALYKGSMDRFSRLVPWLVLVFVALPTSVVWMIDCITDVIYIRTNSPNNILIAFWIPQAFLAGSISVFCLLSVIKLFITLRMRWRMGLRQFGPFQIIFVMSTQTMIIPSIFTYINIGLEGQVATISSLTSLLVVLFLPLSSLWARYHSVAEPKDMFKRLPFSRSTTTLGSPRAHTTNSSTTTTPTLANGFEKSPTTPPKRSSDDVPREGELDDYHRIVMSVGQSQLEAQRSQ